MSKRMIARAALVAAATAATACALAGPVQAYPPGTDPVVSTAAGGFVTGAAIPVAISNIAPGCDVQFTMSLNGKTVLSSTAKANASGDAATTIPGQQTAGAYTVTAHGVPSTSNPDCATGDVSTIVVVSSNGANVGNGSSTSQVAGAAPVADNAGIFASIAGALTGTVTYLGDHARMRNLLLIVVVAAVGLWFLLAWRRRREIPSTTAIDVPGSSDNANPTGT